MAEMTSKFIAPSPKFLLEGYADYGNDEREISFEGKTLKLPQRTDYGFIGVKADAPQWAKDEYEQWVKTRKEAKELGIKL